jgi:hypothetical protein
MRGAACCGWKNSRRRFVVSNGSIGFSGSHLLTGRFHIPFLDAPARSSHLERWYKPLVLYHPIGCPSKSDFDPGMLVCHPRIPGSKSYLEIWLRLCPSQEPQISTEDCYGERKSDVKEPAKNKRVLPKGISKILVLGFCP